MRRRQLAGFYVFRVENGGDRRPILLAFELMVPSQQNDATEYR